MEKRLKTGNNNMKRCVLIIVALLFTAVTAGCNTMQGLGQDIQQGGQSLEKAARK
jgi:predicted small secreted protein